ncbi:uncharacterized protein Z520_11646 [Fonsecaea multimorphosa CBS 102226]|uniref:Tachykinin family protein n=1 Tax=Fonsecaea multimorphosa CBS 102226 TaxID=1442371 RepID=A0A0D2JHF0_9EURO|nr:uncharacterized protein Z520_11646 [Fonsecaea multimorphosa CBS 102226]KIX92617.1 hypothetical protein Z520_11646 [Fonsecaea multimorphosa CBS 102226]OAL17920.1 hypothetical protein AYO22_11184 [Fonsecaea multimorphosa]
MFVTYTHPSQLKDPGKQQQVSSFAARKQQTKSERKRSEGKTRASKTRSFEPVVFRAVNSTQRRKAKFDHRRPQTRTPPGPDANDLVAPLSNTLGGVREDPFKSYPIEATYLVKWAVDQYVQDVAVKSRELFTDSNGDNWLMTYRFSTSLQSEILFECLILYTLAQLPPSYTPFPGLRQMCLQYRANILKKLRQRISDPRLWADDTTLHAIVSLLGSDFHMAEDDYVEMHRAGLRQVVAMRGGLESGNFDAMTKLVVSSTEYMCDMAVKRRRKTQEKPITPELILQYPKHPFPPEISDHVTKLPAGFRELALSCKISNQTIGLLYQLASRVSGERPEALPHVWGRSEQFGLMRVVATEAVPKLERHICLLALVFERSWIATTSDSAGFRRMYGRMGQVFRDRLQELTKNMIELGTDVDSDFQVWTTMIIVTATDECKLSEDEGKELMALAFMLCPQMKSWDTTMKALKRYYWNELLMARWHSEWLFARSYSL